MSNISVNKQVKPLVEKLIESHEKLNLGISESEGGAKIIDAGIKHKGCLEAGRLITEICMGGLGSVFITSSDLILLSQLISRRCLLFILNFKLRVLI